MTMKTLIHDEETVKQFFANLPKLENDEVYLCMIQVRRKYTDKRNFGHDPIVVRQLFRRSKPEYMLDKLKQIEGKALRSINYRNGKQFPYEAMVIYFVLSPKSMIEAFYKFQMETNREIQQIIRTYHNGNDPNYYALRKLDTNLYSNIHKSNSYKPYILIDIDDSSIYEDVKKSLDNHDLSQYIDWVTETRGGYHIILEKNADTNILFDPRNTFIKEFEKEIKDKKLEIKKDPMTPIPGTIQGGAIVKFDTMPE